MVRGSVPNTAGVFLHVARSINCRALTKIPEILQSIYYTEVRDAIYMDATFMILCSIVSEHIYALSVSCLQVRL